MTRPIIGFLTDFAAVAAPPDMVPAAAPPPFEGPSEAEVLAGRLEAARAEGVAEGRRLGAEAAARRQASLVEQHAAALSEARAQWAEAEGGRIAGELASALAALENRLAEDLAAVLGPLVEPALRARTVADCRKAIADLLAGQEGSLVEVRGPADLLEPLQAAFAERPSVSFTPGDHADVSIDAGDTTLRSQLALWSERFERALLAST